jgi:energy-coupling factor transport system permease protein
MSEAFSLYLDHPSPLHRLHPLTKLSLVGVFLIGALALPGAWTAFAVLIVGILPVAVLGRTGTRLLGLAGRMTLPFALSVFLVQGFFWPGGTPVAAFGPLSLKREGLLFAAASTGRILALVSAILLLALTTRPDRLMSALAQRGLPASLAYVIVATLQIVPRFQAKAAAILNAQQARALETTGPLARRARAMLPVIVPLVLSSLVDVEERALAMEARAFSHAGTKTSLIVLPQARWEPAFRRGLLLAMIAIGAVSVWMRWAET